MSKQNTVIGRYKILKIQYRDQFRISPEYHISLCISTSLGDKKNLLRPYTDKQYSRYFFIKLTFFKEL
jgi:hypothetical protein